MSDNSIDPEFSKDPDVTEFAQNDNLFRTPITLVELQALPRANFDDFGGREGYDQFTKNLVPVFFIDLWDVLKYLNVKKQAGFDPIKIKTIAEIVCDHLGNESEFHDVLWQSFDEDIASLVVAELGISEYNALMSQPFYNAMHVVSMIADIIKRYLVNARTPIVEGECIYKVGEYKNGIIALQLRHYDELVATYVGEEPEDDEED